ncbi:ribosomal protein S10 [Nadsonia fulvescens var. elongata DSM 6958]|uniref:Ribosomal protein S10 n=1 Tax=Nadsonia fulvescens var. elongata DSM 6958 TaxID=857566 RepID=A0A1E3PLK4_9ASCO|nr:ribosomal protein S10 [Nadsonia fulvescens var. elongata DSM 6958]
MTSLLRALSPSLRNISITPYKSILGLSRQGQIRLNSNKPVREVEATELPQSIKANLYSSKYTHSNTTERVPDSGHPLPINVEANYYAPLRVEVPTHADHVGTLTLRGHESETLDFYMDFLLRACYYLKMPIIGPRFLKKKRELWTVTRAHFVHSKSKQNFERITLGRQLKIMNTNPEVVQLFFGLARRYAPAGVSIRADLFDFEHLGVGKRMTDIKLSTDRTDVQEPKYEHFGTDKNADVAQRVRELLEDPVFKKHLKKEE